MSIPELERTLSYWRFKGKKIVFTNGCFDILHLGHIEYLAKASDFGHVLIVGMNSDSSVRMLKGENRPVNDENSRAGVLASLFFIDAIIIFEEETPAELIKLIEPDVLVKGGDYLPEQIAGYETVVTKGGEVKIVDLVPGYSTSHIENKIRNRDSDKQ